MRLSIAAGHPWRSLRGQTGGYALIALWPWQSNMCGLLRRAWRPVASNLAAYCAKRAGLLRRVWWPVASGLVAVASSPMGGSIA